MTRERREAYRPLSHVSLQACSRPGSSGFGWYGQCSDFLVSHTLSLAGWSDLARPVLTSFSTVCALHTAVVYRCCSHRAVSARQRLPMVFTSTVPRTQSPGHQLTRLIYVSIIQDKIAFLFLDKYTEAPGFFFPNLKRKLLLLSPFHLLHSQSGHVLSWEELTWPTARVPRKVSAGAGGEGREQKKSMPGCEVFRGSMCSPRSPGLS